MGYGDGRDPRNVGTKTWRPTNERFALGGAALQEPVFDTDYEDETGEPPEPPVVYVRTIANFTPDYGIESGPYPKDRVCCHCNTVLSTYNPDPMCRPCQGGHSIEAIAKAVVYALCGPKEKK